MKRPKISIIIPAYNEKDYIERTLKSLRSQKTKVPYEIIVCDNNSTDKTVRIAENYADKVVCEKKQGQAFARNKGAAVSKGKYLVHTDADTVFPKDFIEKVYPIFKSGKYVGFCCGKWDFNEQKGLKSKIAAKINSLFSKMIMLSDAEKNKVVLPGWCLCTPRAVFKKVKGFAPQNKLFDDYQYSLAIEPLGLKAYFPDIGVRSSTRRVEGSLISAIEYFQSHYPSDMHIKDIFRKSLYHKKPQK